MASDPTPRNIHRSSTGHLITVTAGIAAIGVIALLIYTHLVSGTVSASAGFGRG